MSIAQQQRAFEIRAVNQTPQEPIPMRAHPGAIQELASTPLRTIKPSRTRSGANSAGLPSLGASKNSKLGICHALKRKRRRKRGTIDASYHYVYAQ